MPSEVPFLDWCSACHEDGYFRRVGKEWVVACSKCGVETEGGSAREAALWWNAAKVKEVVDVGA